VLTDVEAQKAGIDYPLSECPTSGYKCCEMQPDALALPDKSACVCWNSANVTNCDGTVPIVAGCPSASAQSPSGPPPSSPPPSGPPPSANWCCNTSGFSCLCRDDQGLCGNQACQGNFPCCGAGSDQFGHYCECFLQANPFGSTCEAYVKNGHPQDTVVPACP
jgi:hypothetical protein